MPRPIDVPVRARERLSATVEALTRPERYPEAVGGVDSIETHMAWVFLTETHAFKLKKPVRTRLVDYTTVEARRRACLTEVRLNRRLAGPVYRGVVPVVAGDSGIEVGGDGPVVDWLVKMQRLPQRRMLDACIKSGTVQDAWIRQLGRKLAAFYDRAQPVDWTPSQYRGRLRENILAKGASLERPHYGLDRSATRRATASQLDWISRHVDLLGARAQHVVDAHGDLRPEHVCLTDPPQVIDCLEFNRSLRLHDPLSDLSFLSLECRRLGANWVGERLIARYREYTGDDAPPALIPFYESYHALIRAAIMIWHLDDETVEQSDFWRRQADDYLHFARVPH